MSGALTSLLSARETIRVQTRVFQALMLRDIRTRFFGSAWGYLLAIAWPLSHVVILVVINSSLGRVPPYGESSALFFATGCVPYAAFLYPSRFIMLGVPVNKALLGFPVVKLTDLLFARALVELLSSGLVVILLCVGFWLFGIDFMPRDVVQAASALGAAMLLGLGFGVLSAMIVAAAPSTAMAFNLSAIIIWMLSGVVAIPESMPAQIRYYLAFNPVLQCVEWMRAAYYEGYGAGLLDTWYTIAMGLILLVIGLGGERMFRGRMLE